MSGNPILAVIASIAAAVERVDVSTLQYVDKILVSEAIGDEVEPPAVVIGPPALEFEGMCRPPTASDLVVYVVVDKTERWAEQLYQLVPAVAAAIDEYVAGAAVLSAKPGTFPVGSRELPAYGIAVSIDL